MAVEAVHGGIHLFGCGFAVETNPRPAPFDKGQWWMRRRRKAATIDSLCGIKTSPYPCILSPAVAPKAWFQAVPCVVPSLAVHGLGQGRAWFQVLPWGLHGALSGSRYRPVLDRFQVWLCVVPGRALRGSGHGRGRFGAGPSRMEHRRSPGAIYGVLSRGKV